MSRAPMLAFNPTASSTPMSRRDALRLFSNAVCAIPFAAVAGQGDKEISNKPKKGQRGSKEAKGYQLCLSQCLYDCTTPRAGLAKQRTECRVECKDECAVSREQL